MDLGAEGEFLVLIYCIAVGVSDSPHRGASIACIHGTGSCYPCAVSVDAVRVLTHTRWPAPVSFAPCFLLWFCPPSVFQPHVVAFLRKSFVSPRGPADVWVDIADVNDYLQNWTRDRFDVDASAADLLLERKWRLPQRGRRSQAAGAGEAVAEAEDGAGVSSGPSKTMAYKYLHRTVSHFYQGLGNKAVAAFGTYVNKEEDIGSLRRVRGTRTKVEVVFSPGEAAAMLANDSFITEFAYRAGITRALEVVFSVAGVLDRYTEVATVPGGHPGICCLLAHVAFVTMKIRAHLKKKVAPAADSDEADEVSPILNGGHRPEWVEELFVVQQAFASQGGRPSNGLRITDGANSRCTDPSHRAPLTPTRADPSDPPSAGLPPAVGAVLQTAATGASGSTPESVDGEEDSDGGAAGPLDDAAVAAAHAAAAHAMEGVFEELD